MFKEFAEILRAEGVSQMGLARIDAWLADQNYVVTWDWQSANRRAQEAVEAERKARQAAAVEAAVPYTGPAINCQATVYGERVSSWQCQHRAKFVITNQDGRRMNVCKAHVKTRSASER